MADYLIKDTTLIAIAQAIRDKLGTIDQISVNDMAEQIGLIRDGIGGTNSGIEDIATEAEMDAALISANVGKVYRYTGTTKEKYFPGDLYVVEVS